MTRFYEAMLGLKVTKHVTISGEWVDQTVGLNGVNADVVYLDPPSGPRIELIRYRAPEASAPRSAIELPNTPGFRHLAFRVDDIDALVAKLSSAGVQFFSAVQNVPESQVRYPSGVRKRIVYFRDPEGNILELCEYK
jgi:catechol 2,3-dioxygenase-like lactoylglutathione lyase family enzyme